jgi:hypothetical protein
VKYLGRQERDRLLASIALAASATGVTEALNLAQEAQLFDNEAFTARNANASQRNLGRQLETEPRLGSG